MVLSLRHNTFINPFIRLCRRYSEEKSIYQRDEEGEKERVVHGKPYPDWRKPWIKRQGEWQSKLSLFVEKNPSMDILNAMQKLPDLTVQDVQTWWTDMKTIQEIENQRYLPQRVATLGSNLAAVHFFTFRQAAVRLKDSNEWIAGDILTLKLPEHYVENYFVEAIDCTKFHHNGIRYEGLQNLSGLSFLKWLSLKDNKYVDVWGIDRIAGQNGNSIEYLDISGCNLCVGCIFALARMPALKYLTITDPGDDITMQVAISTLESQKPHLMIKAVEKTIDDNKL